MILSEAPGGKPDLMWRRRCSSTGRRCLAREQPRGLNEALHPTGAAVPVLGDVKVFQAALVG
jgi:hypothetical protein